MSVTVRLLDNLQPYHVNMNMNGGHARVEYYSTSAI